MHTSTQSPLHPQTHTSMPPIAVHAVQRTFWKSSCVTRVRRSRSASMPASVQIAWWSRAKLSTDKKRQTKKSTQRHRGQRQIDKQDRQTKKNRRKDKTNKKTSRQRHRDTAQTQSKAQTQRQSQRPRHGQTNNTDTDTDKGTDAQAHRRTDKDQDMDIDRHTTQRHKGIDKGRDRQRHTKHDKTRRDAGSGRGQTMTSRPTIVQVGNALPSHNTRTQHKGRDRLLCGLVVRTP